MICTENDTTLAIGASVPTTNEGPLCAAGVTGPLLVTWLPHPAIATAIANRPKIPGKILAAEFEVILVNLLIEVW
jgi:hypothetical protein